MDQLEEQVLETVIAEAAPGETRLEMFQRLAKLKLESKEVFKVWANGVGLTGDMRKQAEAGFLGCWDFLRVFDLFDVVKTAAVLDESFRLPQLKARSEEYRGNVERKFAAMMQRISILALTIQREYEAKSQIEVPDGPSNSDS